MSGPRILIYDLELAPNIVRAWSLWKPTISINQIVEPTRIICFSYRWVGEKKAHVVSEWDDGYDDMIAQLWALFDEADAICGYNSIGFDDKHSKAAFFLAGLTPPSPYRQIDLLRVVRKHMNLPSRKLDYVAQAIGLGSKVKHSGMELWNNVTDPPDEETGRKARNLMSKYCKQDVNLTHDLYMRLLPWIDNGVNAGLYVDEEKPLCMNCGSDRVQRRGFFYSAAARYRRFQCQACQKWMRGKSLESTTDMRPV